jgi:hypothetical protein
MSYYLPLLPGPFRLCCMLLVDSPQGMLQWAEVLKKYSYEAARREQTTVNVIEN